MLVGEGDVLAIVRASSQLPAARRSPASCRPGHTGTAHSKINGNQTHSQRPAPTWIQSPPALIQARQIFAQGGGNTIAGRTTVCEDPRNTELGAVPRW